MAINKELLRQAICDGVFNTPPIGPAGTGFGRVTSAVLAAVAGMTDDQINAVLATYKAKKLAQLNTQLTQEQGKVTSLTAQIAVLTPTATLAS